MLTLRKGPRLAPSAHKVGGIGQAPPSYFSVPFSNKQIGIAGHSYVACLEFGKDGVEAKSINTFGSTGGDRESKYFSDQAELFSQGKLKDSWFDWDDVLENSIRTYHPGE